MWEGAADAAPVEIDNPALLSQGENQAPAKRIAALIADQSRAQQQIKGIAESGQLPPEITAGSIAEFHVFKQPGITDSSLPQILGRFRMTVKLRLVKAGGVVEQLGVVSESEAVLQIGDGLLEGEALGKLHKANQVPAASTAVAVEEILAGIDVERRAGIGVQRAQSHELFARTHAASGPVALL